VLAEAEFVTARLDGFRPIPRQTERFVGKRGRNRWFISDTHDHIEWMFLSICNDCVR